MDKEDKIFRIIVPVEDQAEYKDGKKVVVKKKIFPGYVLVEMLMSDDSWYVVRNTPGVTGFVGSGNKPIALLEEEAEAILRQMGVEDHRPRATYEVGETIMVISGPFRDLAGVVSEIYPEKLKLKVTVSMFGRETPVELDYIQVEKY